MSENLTKEKRPFTARRFFETSRSVLAGLGIVTLIPPVGKLLVDVSTFQPMSFDISPELLIGSAALLSAAIIQVMLGITKPQTVRRTRLR